MASSKFVGLITCAHCGNENATVHEQQTGTKKGRLYYRCYSEINGSVMLCGTIQCIGQSGQKYINDNMRPIGQQIISKPEQIITKQIAEPIAQPVEPESPPQPKIEPIGQSEPAEPEKAPIADPEPVLVPVRKSMLEFLING